MGFLRHLETQAIQILSAWCIFTSENTQLPLRSKLPGNFISHHSPCTPHNHYSEFCHHDISVSLLGWGGFFLYNDLARFWCWHELYWPLTMICNCVFFHILWKEFVYSWCLVSGKIHQWSFNLGLKFSLYKILNYALDLFSRYEASEFTFFLISQKCFQVMFPFQINCQIYWEGDFFLISSYHLLK